jgi:hypothetical protein
MARFMFSISNGAGLRRAGVVQSDDFASALSVLESEVPTDAGAVLEIGVPGFPPARYRAVSLEGAPLAWLPQGQLAA